MGRGGVEWSGVEEWDVVEWCVEHCSVQEEWSVVECIVV